MKETLKCFFSVNREIYEKQDSFYMFLAREHHGGNHPPKVVFWTLQNGKTNTSSRNKFLLKLTPDNFLLRITFFFLNQNETVDGWNPREAARFQTNAGFRKKNRPPSQSEGFQDQSDWPLGGQKRFIKSQLFLEIWHPSMEDFSCSTLYKSRNTLWFQHVSRWLAYVPRRRSNNHEIDAMGPGSRSVCPWWSLGFGNGV